MIVRLIVQNNNIEEQEASYELYHTERKENAIQDIESKLKSCT